MYRRPARSLWSAAILAVAAICLGGCKTSNDATAVATQLSTTSKALSGYYAALDKELQATDQLNILGRHGHVGGAEGLQKLPRTR